MTSSGPQQLRTTSQIVAIIGWGLLLLASLGVIAWVIGRVLSDRYSWSQWLLWIPTPVALAAAALGLLGALLLRGRSRALPVMTWGVVLGAIAVYFACIEHRFLRTAPKAEGGLRIVHWSMGHGKADRMNDHVKALLELDGDITIANEGGDLFYHRPAKEWKPPDAQLIPSWPFWVLSKLPILKAQTLVEVDDMSAALLIVDAREKLGRPLVIWMINMPSNPRLPRMAMVQRMARLLNDSGAPAPDLVIGDLNITRGSASLRHWFPVLRHAFDDAGHGYGASYHRRFPLYHIDHVLLNDSLRATRYDLVDTGLGRHRVQVVEVLPASSQAALR